MLNLFWQTFLVIWQIFIVVSGQILNKLYSYLVTLLGMMAHLKKGSQIEAAIQGTLSPFHRRGNLQSVWPD